MILEIFLLTEFSGEMLISSRTTTLLQLFCEFSLYLQVIFKGIGVADDTLSRKSTVNGLNHEDLLLLPKILNEVCL